MRKAVVDGGGFVLKNGFKKFGGDFAQGVAGNAFNEYAMDGNGPKVWSKPTLGGAAADILFNAMDMGQEDNASPPYSAQQASFQMLSNGYDSPEIEQLMSGQPSISSTLKQKMFANTFAQTQGSQAPPHSGLLESHDAVTDSQLKLEKAKADVQKYESIRDESYESISARTANFTPDTDVKDKY